MRPTLAGRCRGRAAVAIAVAAPLTYALSRYAWVLGIPLGISDDLMRQIKADDMSGAAAGLASVATGGALLTWASFSAGVRNSRVGCPG